MVRSDKSKSYPGVITRPVKKKTSEEIEQTVHLISECDLFFIIHYQTTAEHHDWVAVGQNRDGEFSLELYEGQPIIGVVQILGFYQLTQSEQWNPGIQSRFTDW